MREDQIQIATVKYLEKMNIFCHSVPNELGGKNAMLRTKHFVAMGLKHGVADLVIWWPDGKIGYVEMKSERGKQTDLQRKFQKRCEKYGVRYDVCHSLDEVKELVIKYC